MIGYIVETGQMATIDFQEGNVPPAASSLEFTKQCEAAFLMPMSKSN